MMRLTTIAIASGIAMFVMAVQHPADEARAGHPQLVNSLQELFIQDDSFYNWDSVAQTYPPITSEVDWPVSLLFWNDADVNKVKDLLGEIGLDKRILNSTKYLWLNEFFPGLDDVVDADSGVKRGVCPFSTTQEHVRVYAPPDFDSFFNVSWGFFVLGSTHIDKDECIPGSKMFGWSEDAEDYVSTFIVGEVGFGNVAPDWASFFNETAYVQVMNHVLKNNGKATAVRVP